MLIWHQIVFLVQVVVGGVVIERKARSRLGLDWAVQFNNKMPIFKKVPNITTESNNLLCEKYRDQNTEIPQV